MWYYSRGSDSGSKFFLAASIDGAWREDRFLDASNVRMELKNPDSHHKYDGGVEIVFLKKRRDSDEMAGALTEDGSPKIVVDLSYVSDEQQGGAATLMVPLSGGDLAPYLSASNQEPGRDFSDLVGETAEVDVPAPEERLSKGETRLLVPVGRNALRLVPHGYGVHRKTSSSGSRVEMYEGEFRLGRRGGFGRVTVSENGRIVEDREDSF